MTTEEPFESRSDCPAELLLKRLSGKWKPRIFKIALDGPFRFNKLIRQISGSNKQSIAVALKELEEQGILERVIISEKPLHIEYTLSSKGKAVVPIFRQLEDLL